MVTHCAASTLVCIATDLTLESESVRTQAASLWKRDIDAGKTPDVRKKPTVFLLLA
jgi:16S rRNA (cytidine1402-2'-O)-methyltransferase